MNEKIKIFLLSILLLSGCTNSSNKSEEGNSSFCRDTNCNKDKTTDANFACKLTTPELQKRKATVLESLRKEILEKKELPNGYAFKFSGSDKMIDELTEFAKTERQCCDFFAFNLRVTGDTTSVWFEITGERETKEFIKKELEL
jgi:hypothetical protein